MSYTDTAGFLLLIMVWAAVYLIHFPFFGTPTKLPSAQQDGRSFNGSWYPPNKTQINDLQAVINGTDVFGFIFSDAPTSPSNAREEIQNWCNMPHVNPDSYPVPPAGYTLEYVEVVRSYSHNFPRRKLLKVLDSQTSQTYPLRCQHLSTRILHLGM